jgi:hypothetical protein
MIEAIQNSNTKQILRMLEGNSRNEIIALCVYLNARTDYEISVYGSKTQLLDGLRGVDADVLREAIEALFGPEDDGCDEEDEVDDDDYSDDEEEEDEDE